MIDVVILNTGDELVYGDTLNRDGFLLSQKLTALGMKVERIVCVGDDPGILKDEIIDYYEEGYVIFITGGLGIGPRDITRDVLKDIFDIKFVPFQPSLEKVRKMYGELRDDVIYQSFIPEGSKAFENKGGIAPGFVIDDRVFVLPGPPDEIESMWDEVERYIEDIYGDRLKPLKVHVLRLYGIYEGDIKRRISELSLNEVTLKIQLRKPGIDIVLRGERIDDELVERLRTIFKDHIYTEGYESIEEVLGRELRRRGFTLSVFESCTGGMIQNMITNIPGSSDYFIGGGVVYSNELKVKLCGVKEETLDRFGAVSKEVVQEMVEGGMRRYGTDTCIAVSGIAGPGGGTPEKPVGLVYIGVGVRDRVYVKRYNFSGTRFYIKKKTAFTSLFELLKKLREF